MKNSGRRRDTRFPVRSFVAPQRDQEVHRHQHHFPEEEEQEHVDGREHADNAAQDPHQVQVEEALIFSLISRQSKAPPERRAGRSAPPLAATVRRERQMDRDAKTRIHRRTNSDCHSWNTGGLRQ